MSVLDLVRPELRRLEPYRAAEQAADVTRLNANESPYTRGSATGGTPLNRYPEVRPRRLTRVLAGHFGCEPQQLLVTRGSSEAIDLVMRVFCRAAVDNIVITPPTFSMYEHYATLQGVEARQVPLNADDDFRFDAKRVLAACDDSSKLIVVCSPNNPTGLSAGVDEIRAVADARRERSVVVVDEAYIEFAATPSAYKLLDEFDNLIVLRTLSKAQGLAGARCGGLIARCELLDRFDAVQAPYSMPTPVVECVLRELGDASASRYSRNIRALIGERDRLAAALAELAGVVRVFPSDANFLLVRFTDAPAIARACRAARILVREPGAELEGCIRITVGTPGENDHLLDVLAARREACA